MATSRTSTGAEGREEQEEAETEVTLQEQLLVAGQQLAEERAARERLDAVVAQLSSEAETLRAGFQTQAVRARKAKAAAQEEARRRQQAEGEVVDHREDIAEQACNQQELETERDRLEQQRDQLRGELARTRADLAHVEHKFAEAERSLTDREQLALRPTALLAAKDRKLKQLTKQLEEKTQAMKVAKEQLSAARAPRGARASGDAVGALAAQPQAAGRPEAGGSREQLVRDLASAQRGQACAEERCWKFEETLEERSRAIEEAEASARRAAERLEQEEERGRRLLEQLREAEAQAHAAQARARAQAPASPGADGAPSTPPSPGLPPPTPPSGRRGSREQPAPEPDDCHRESAEGAASALEASQAEVSRLEGQLREAAHLLSEYEAVATRLRAQLAERNAARAAFEDRLAVSARRCAELETAGKRLLSELADKIAALEDLGCELRLLWRRAAECEAAQPPPAAQPPGRGSVRPRLETVGSRALPARAVRGPDAGAASPRPWSLAVATPRPAGRPEEVAPARCWSSCGARANATTTRLWTAPARPAPPEAPSAASAAVSAAPAARPAERPSAPAPGRRAVSVGPRAVVDAATGHEAVVLPSVRLRSQSAGPRARFSRTPAPLKRRLEAPATPALTPAPQRWAEAVAQTNTRVRVWECQRKERQVHEPTLEPERSRREADLDGTGCRAAGAAAAAAPAAAAQGQDGAAAAAAAAAGAAWRWGGVGGDHWSAWRHDSYGGGGAYAAWVSCGSWSRGGDIHAATAWGAARPWTNTSWACGVV